MRWAKVTQTPNDFLRRVCLRWSRWQCLPVELPEPPPCRHTQTCSWILSWRCSRLWPDCRRLALEPRDSPDALRGQRSPRPCDGLEVPSTLAGSRVPSAAVLLSQARSEEHTSELQSQ